MRFRAILSLPFDVEVAGQIAFGGWRVFADVG